MEFGPRALGARSIIGDAQSPKMQEVMNLKIKFRESFRPVCAHRAARAACPTISTWTAKVPTCCWSRPWPSRQRRELTDGEQKRFGLEKLLTIRSTIPGRDACGLSRRACRR